MTLRIFWLILLAEVFAAAAQVFFKKSATGSPSSLRGLAGYLRFVTRVLRTPAVWCGLVSAACGMGVWLVVLARVDLSLAFPLSSIQYILIMIASSVFLGERVTWTRILGTLCIAVGVALIPFG